MNNSAAAPEGFPALLNRLWRWGKRALWGAFVIGALLVASEAARVAELVRWLPEGYRWLAPAGIGVLALWALWRVRAYFRTPKALRPPTLPPAQEGWNRRQQAAYQSFAVRYLRRQASNRALPADARKAIPDQVQRLRAPLEGKAVTDPVRAARALTARVEGALQVVVKPLDQRANEMIREAAVQVAIATAISPSVLMDGMITMTRNVDLVTRIAELYYGRPGAGGTFRILRDVFGSAVLAGAAQALSDNVGGILTEVTGSWSSKFLGPLGQGAINGLMTLRFGAAACQRCKSLAGTGVQWSAWKPADYRRAAAALSKWISDAVGPGAGHPLSQLLSAAGGMAAAAAGSVSAAASGRSAPGAGRPAASTAAPGADRSTSAGAGAAARRPADPVLDSDLLGG